MSNKFYVASLYRFGYDLTVIETTEAKAIAAIMKEYKRAYKDINGTDPTKDRYDEFYTYYGYAKECIEVEDLELGKVEWR